MFSRMSKEQIKRIIEARIHEDGMTDTGIEGVKLFRATQAVPCAPAVYEPSVIAIVSGSKEAAVDGRRFNYDDKRYLCCPMSMPVEAGTPNASQDNPLYGIYISLDPRKMTELAIEIENASDSRFTNKGFVDKLGIALADWDELFTEAMLRLLQLGNDQTDLVVLGKTRLRELYYAILKGDAGNLARQAFGVGNAIARSIAHISSHLEAPISIEDLAKRAGMSRAVFHRKFKSATGMSPIQFAKAMRLNRAALKIAGGATVNEAAIGVGYTSVSQFSREFKRLYGSPPRNWSDSQIRIAGFA